MINIIDVSTGSPAEKAGISAGMCLVSLDGRAPRDLLDYYSLSDPDVVELTVTTGGVEIVAEIHKHAGEPLGLQFDTAVFDRIQTCKNSCVFCFVEQLPKGMRRSLYLKDDDYRLSLLWGNFITLTNLTDEDVDRIVAERISPLYVSLHSTDAEIHGNMLRVRESGRKDPLKALARFLEAELEVHVQIVLCPGYNDGEALRRSLDDLTTGNFGGVASVGIVPVGLSGHRGALEQLRPVSVAEAAALVQSLTSMQKNLRRRLGYSHIYLADEFYLLAGKPFPPYTWYDEFPQIENGIGLSAQFLRGSRRRIAASKRRPNWEKATLVTGEMAFPLIEQITGLIKEKWSVELDILMVKNTFFGGNVAVAPLLTGHDLIPALRGLRGTVILPDLIFGAEERLLDGPTLEDLRKETAADLFVLSAHGSEFIAGLERLDVA